MLTPQQKTQAQKRLKMMSSQIQFQKKTKQTAKSSTKAINDLISGLKDDPKAQKNLLVQISNKIGPKIIAFERLTRGFQDAQQKMKADKDRLNKQKLLALEEKERLQLSIEQIKEIMKKIQQTVRQQVEWQGKKRQKIDDDLQKSLGEIRQKIITFQQQSEQMDRQNSTLRTKRTQTQSKMARLQVEFRQKAQQKDQQVRKEKQQLMVRLQSLETQVSEVTQINKLFSIKQKGNFDKKLSLYLKGKKFPQYSTSFENSARTIDQCKEQLFKGVQRMNDAKQMAEKFEKQTKDFSNTFLLELKKKTQKEARIQTVKKQKELVRQKIIALQNKIKEQKTKVQPAQ